MKIAPIQKQNFKGYDACPLKKLYMQGVRNEKHANVFNELKGVCEDEGIELLLHTNPGFSKEFSGKYDTSQNPWAQDHKSFVRINGETKMLKGVCKVTPNELEALSDFTEGLGYHKCTSWNFLTGGNCFIGKKPDGEKWVLMGIDETDVSYFGNYDIFYNQNSVCEDYGVKDKNIYEISQPHFHLDMAIRPIGYPYILVNDENMALQNSMEQGGDLASETKAYYDKLYGTEKTSKKKQKKSYTKTEQTISELEKFGFKPIRIGGLYTSGINYMNAIINQHPDGTISYITNSSKGSKHEGLDEIFERELRAKVPNIRNVYFISGGQDKENPELNSIMEILSEHNGGIHCLTLEEPNFEAWG